MPLWKRLGFLFVFGVPALMPAAAWLGTRTGLPNLTAWFPLFFLFVLLPLADYALGHDPRNLDGDANAALEHDTWFKGMTLAALPAQLGVLAWSGWHFVHAGFDVSGTLGWMLSQGIVGGVLAINVAHELIHKDTKLERAAGGLLLTSVGYHGFKIEHVRGHHVHVSPPVPLKSSTTSNITGCSAACWIPAAMSAPRTCIRGIPITCSATCCCSICSGIRTTTKPRAGAIRYCCIMPIARSCRAGTPACSCSRYARHSGSGSSIRC